MTPPKKSDHSIEKIDISKEEINALPLGSFEGKIEVIDQSERISRIIEELNENSVIGFDTETRPSFRKGEKHAVSLLQLAAPKKVFIIQLKHTGIPGQLTSFLENKKIVKAGLGLKEDLRALNRLKHFNPNNFIDLAILANEAGLKVESVKKLTALLLGFRISKSVQTSNWESKNLTDRQITYAATDAWVCLEIYKRLYKIKKHNDNFV